MLNYIEPVFRPPSEWKSLILQVTNGCSWNRCRFCEMYTSPQKRFTFKSLQAFERDLQMARQQYAHVPRIFLADGDAMALSVRRLKERLILIRKYFPEVQRISSYCLPRNLRRKRIEELAELRALGLRLVYVGVESGDDEVLRMVDKGETYLSHRDALLKLHSAGITTSVMILNGLGGRKYWQQHARHSAWLLNETQPKYVSTLVVSFPFGTARLQEGFAGQFEMPSLPELLQELRLFLSELTLENSLFRSDHASNYLVLKGTLPRDKDRLLATIDQALTAPDTVPLRAEWERGL
ncbi:MAG: radical SAM protein [Gammaproteobacteria bacterium]|nr:MAG: radical SAM protein [Gammaproteobacteria bacterium]